VIGTGKRTGKTAVAGHWAGLLRDRGTSTVIVSMGRGGPAEPQLADADTGLAELLAIAAEGRHAASDYLEDAVLARVPTVGCRRVGGGLVGEPYESNVGDGARLAAAQNPEAILLEGSGSCIPPVEADVTVCVVGRGADVSGLGRYHLLRSRLALVMDDRPADDLPCPALHCTLVTEPAEQPPADARVALFTTGAPSSDGVDPLVASTALARRSELDRDLDRAVAERCDTYLVELKAAAIDTVAVRAEREGARVIFLRNRPVALDGDLDNELVGLHDSA
jgi:cyclic 2,3-diphosphoglycerate synthase